MGLGYAWFAQENIRQELESGALAPLPLAEGAERHAVLYLVFADREATGPGARRLAEIIQALVAETGAGRLT
jgi:DNA-binding transcriptional LysR family regulator